MRLALRMVGIAEGVDELRVAFEPAAPRSERDFWEVAAVRASLGVSPQQILREAGYSQEDIDRFFDERAEFARLGASIAQDQANTLPPF
jgi:hypothetical protein